MLGRTAVPVEAAGPLCPAGARSRGAFEHGGSLTLRRLHTLLSRECTRIRKQTLSSCGVSLAPSSDRASVVAGKKKSKRFESVFTEQAKGVNLELRGTKLMTCPVHRFDDLAATCTAHP